jgi:ribosome-associated protein
VTAAAKGTSRRFPAQVRRAIDAAQDRKAIDVVVLDLRPAEGFTDYFVIATGRNTRQLQAIAESVKDALSERGAKPAHIEGGETAGWILLDYFDFIVHIFSPESRSFYALERLWGSAKRFDIPDPAPITPKAS